MRPRIAQIAAAVTIAAVVAVGASWWHSDWSHEDVEKLPNFNGKNLEAVIANLGEPNEQLAYAMADCPGDEFRIELYNTYPPGDVKASEARIKELQWHRKRYHIAVWMHQVNGEWIVLDTCRWKEGVEF